MKIRSQARLGAADVAIVSVIFTFSLMLTLMFVLYGLYSYAGLVAYAIKEVQRERAKLIIENVTLTGTLLYFNVSNEGPITVKDLSELDVIVKYYVNESGIIKQVAYLLQFNESGDPGTWYVYRVILGKQIYTYAEHRYLRPGEIAEVIANLPVQPVRGADGVVVIASKETLKAECAFST
ncbi:MAG: hypothetical protein J7L12_03875 [Desulfurococcales archaeon]|nr:hypothetical protein [Desulfurococcales archaeon]